MHSICDLPSPTLPENEFSFEFRDFLRCCLMKNANERSTCSELLNHDFLKKAVPEDPTTDDTEAATLELKSILKALYDHIVNLTNSMMQQSEEELRNRSPRIFGDLTLPAHEVLHFVLFGCRLSGDGGDIMMPMPALSSTALFPKSDPMGLSPTSSESKKQVAKTPRMKLRRPPPKTISKQLHMTEQTYTKIAKEFCKSLAATSS